MSDNSTKETAGEIVGVYVTLVHVDTKAKPWVIINNDRKAGEFETRAEAREAAKKMVGNAIIKALVNISDNLQFDNTETGAL